MNNNTIPNSNGHNHNGLLKSVLPIDELIRTGRLLDDLAAIENFAKSQANAITTHPYDPSNSPHDKLQEEHFQKDCKDLQEAESAAAHAVVAVRDAERRQADIQSGLAEPKLPTKIVAAAVVALAISIGPTLYDQFFSRIDDKILGWVLALGAGACIGAFISWAIVGVRDPGGSRNVLNLAGLVAAIGIGLFCFLLRLQSGELLSAIALSILEISVVILLECLARGLRDHQHAFSGTCEEHVKAAAVAQSLKAEATRRNQTVQEIQGRIDAHKHHLAVRTFCSQKPAEIEQAALDIARKAYYERIAEEQRIRKGLPKEMLS